MVEGKKLHQKHKGQQHAESEQLVSDIDEGALGGYVVEYVGGDVEENTQGTHTYQENPQPGKTRYVL